MDVIFPYKYRITVTDKEGKRYNDFDCEAFDTEEEAVAHCKKNNEEQSIWHYDYLKPYCELTIYHGSLNVWSRKRQN